MEFLPYFYLLYVVGAALIFGSFLNMALARLNTGRSWGGRSHCMTCSHELAWYDLLPVISFVTLLGRCRYCGVSMGVRYLVLELLTVAWVLGMWFVLGWGAPFIIASLVGGVLLLISFYDLRHMIIPDVLLLLLTALTLLGILISGWDVGFTYQAVVGSFTGDRLIAMVGLPLPFFIMWLVTGGRAMGFGDIKMMAWMGLSLGLWGGVEALFIAVWLGGLFGLMVMLLRGCVRLGFITTPRFKARLRESAIPFGPFLALGFMLSLLGVHFLGILL